MKKAKTIFKVLLIVFLVIIIFLAVVVVKHWNTISAVFDGLNHSVEEIENIRIENQKEVEKALSKYPDLHFRNLTDEEISALSQGKISQEDIPYLVTGSKVYVDGEILTNEEYEEKIKEQEKSEDESDDNADIKDTKDKDDSDSSSNKNDNSDKPNNKNSQKKTPTKDSQGNEDTESSNDKTTNNDSLETNQSNDSGQTNGNVQPDVPKTDQELEAVLQKFFVLKATFLADIESRVNGMIADYTSIPKKYRSKTVRNEYANNAIALVSQLEPQYDAQFESVVSELQAVIEKIDGDRNLINTVRDAYKKEKAAIKAKYVSKARKYIQ